MKYFLLQYTEVWLSSGLDDGAEYGAMSQENATFSLGRIEADLIDFLCVTEKPVVVVLGHTASGKTALSIHLAKVMHGVFRRECMEIVNADSRQFYKGFDIGTGKILPQEMQHIPHHLLDVLSPADQVNVAWYQEQALGVIQDTHARHAKPMLVGGSMLYVSSIIDGLMPLPERSEDLRSRLQDEYDFDEGKTLHARLSKIDPQLAETTSANNSVHLIRAMEIYELTGKPPSSLKKKSKSDLSFFIIGCEVETSRRKAAIEERTRELFHAGWVNEVGHLLASGIRLDSPAMQSLGYREIAEAIVGGSVDEEELISNISGLTYKYAKRQMTWWKRDERIRWLRK